MSMAICQLEKIDRIEVLIRLPIKKSLVMYRGISWPYKRNGVGEGPLGVPFLLREILGGPSAS